MVDFFNGLVIIDQKGNLVAQTITTDKLILGASTLGSGVIKAGSGEVAIETTAVSQKSKIFTTAQTEIDTPIFVSDKIIGAGFVVKIKSLSPTDILFDWWITDTK